MTIDHILADIPYFVNAVKNDLDTLGSRVIFFGPEMSGTIAVLARKKFPLTINGAWSSSGIFRAVSANTDFYKSLRNNVVRYGPSTCYNNFQRAIIALKNASVDDNPTHLQTLYKMENRIDFSSAKDVAHFYKTIVDTLPFAMKSHG